MRPLCRHVRIEGIGIDNQLSALEKHGYTLYDIQKINLKTVELGFNASREAEICDFLTQRGFSVSPLPAIGASRNLHALRSNLFLICLALSSLILLCFAMRYVWHIEIRGANAYMGEVRLFLKEEGIHPGIPAERVNIKDLSDKLTRRLPRVAWVRVHFKGLTLCIDVTQGVPMPDIETDGGNGNIVATMDGVIVRIDVYAGTPAVKAGDTVKAGDILIYGRERIEDDGFTGLHARGKVLARSFLSESAAVSATDYQTLRTGGSKLQNVLHFHNFSIPLNDSPAYLTSEYESEFLPFGGAWLPVQLEKRTVYEVFLNPVPPDEARLKAESGRLSMQKLLLSVGENDEIIDKWLDYSMIEGGIIKATAYAEILTDIGQFSPETPN